MITKTITLNSGAEVVKIFKPAKIELDILNDTVTLSYTEEFEDKQLGGIQLKTVTYSTGRNPQVKAGASAEASSALEAFVEGTLTLLEN